MSIFEELKSSLEEAVEIHSGKKHPPESLAMKSPMFVQSESSLMLRKAKWQRRSARALIP